MVSKSDVKFEPVKGGIHAGGQHAQKNSTGVRATHIPSGLVVVIRGRSLASSKRRAFRAIKCQLLELEAASRAERRKADRDRKIREMRIVRTYAFHRREVKDHRTGRRASIEDVLFEGRIELVAPRPHEG